MLFRAKIEFNRLANTPYTREVDVLSIIREEDKTRLTCSLHGMEMGVIIDVPFEAVEILSQAVNKADNVLQSTVLDFTEVSQKEIATAYQERGLYKTSSVFQGPGVWL